MAVTKWALAHANPPATILCAWCGKVVQRRVRKSNDAGLCCSRLCGFAHRDAKRAASKVARLERAAKVKAEQKVAREDGRIRRAELRLHPRPAHPCCICGKMFVPKTYKSVTCSVLCASKTDAYKATARRSRIQRRRKLGRDTYRKKARRLGVPYEPVNRMRVFARDGWRCQLCGTRTPKRLVGAMVANAPELDHIVPFALGGGHVWDNVQCACRHCNGQKGARLRGQLRLMLCSEIGGLAGG